MLEMEDWLVIRDYNSQNMIISEIARKTGRDRKTVRKYLNIQKISASVLIGFITDQQKYSSQALIPEIILSDTIMSFI